MSLVSIPTYIKVRPEHIILIKKDTGEHSLIDLSSDSHTNSDNDNTYPIDDGTYDYLKNQISIENRLELRVYDETYSDTITWFTTIFDLSNLRFYPQNIDPMIEVGKNCYFLLWETYNHLLTFLRDRVK